MDDKSNILKENNELKKRIKELETIIQSSTSAYGSDTITSDSDKLEYDKLKFFFKNAPVGYQSLNNKGIIIDVNDTWLETLGYKRNEVINSSFASYIHPDQKKKFAEMFPILIHSDEIIKNVEFSLLKKDGATICVEFTTIIDRDKDNKFVRTHSLFKDITHYKDVEIKLKHKEERAQAQRNAIAKLAIDNEFTKLNMEVAFERINELISTTLNVARVGIWLLSSYNKKLECISLYDRIENKFSSGHELIVHDYPNYFGALKKESRIYAKDAINDPRTKEMAESYLIPMGITSMLDAGIIIEGQLSGVLCIEHIGSIRTWETDEESFAGSVAAYIGQWLVNDLKKMAEKQAISASSNWQNTFNSITDGIAILDKDQKILQVNESYSNYLEKSSDELIGMECFKALFKSQIPVDDCPFSKMEKSGKRERAEMTINGVIYEVIVDPIYSNGKLSGAVQILSDITEKHLFFRTMQVLVEISKYAYTQHHLKSFLKKVHDLIQTILSAKNFYVALYDKKTDTYTFPYFEDETENLETNLPQSIPGSLTELVRKSNKGQIITEETEEELKKENEISLIGNQSPIWVGAPIKSANTEEAIGVIAIQDYHNPNAYSNQDLEVLELIGYNIGSFIERLSIINDLEEAKQKAIEADKLKSAFLANMSHEIRTPMNGILGFTQLLQEPGLTGEQQDNYISIIQKSGNRMLTTVNDIIDISKIDSGQVEIVLNEINIVDEIESLYTFFKPEANKKGIDLKLNNSIDKNFSNIIIDNNKLQSILTNLIKNAIKYTDSGTIEIGSKIQKDNLVCYVKDTGIGIPKSRQDAVFNRFEQADIEDVHALEGSGLGLAITSSYVEMLDGEIWLESELKKGSVFTFKIPIQYSMTESQDSGSTDKKSKHEKSGSMQKKLNILIAEDDLFSYEYLRVLLEDISEKIVRTKTGAETIEIIKDNNDFDLILMDIKMPVVNGYVATKKIREFNNDIIIIAQTANVLADEKEKVLNAGCNDYIKKPIDSYKLFNIIEKYFN